MIEYTLFICRGVALYRIPTRQGAAGYRSGEWLVADKLWEGRLRLLARGAAAEMRLESPGRCAVWSASEWAAVLCQTRQ